MKKGVIFVVAAFVIAAFFIFDLDQRLSLEYLKSSMSEFQDIQHQYPLIFAGVFFAIYVSVTGLSLPGAVIMTLAAGAFFGVFWGTVIVSFASTFGATLAFLVARYIFRDRIQQRFGQRLSNINEGIKQQGALYLFTLRLVPAVPFFVINLLMALTPIKTRTFYIVSQIGMLAGTIVYVNAGTQLSQLNGLSGILSPSLFFSFILIGIFPFLAKRFVNALQQRRLYAKWQKPKHFDRNLVVIGAGSGGLVSAYIAAAVKAEVTLVEANRMGGDCLNYGCVPSKTLIKSAKIIHQLQSAETYGLENQEVKFSFPKVMHRVLNTIKAIEPHDSVERYSKLGVDVVQGYAKIVNPWTVEIDKADGEKLTLTTRNIIVATGASPVVPDIDGLSNVPYLTSDTLWESMAKREQPPKRLIVLGGGPIGCELAQAFQRLGSQVTIVQRDAQLMPREDNDVAKFALTNLKSDGVKVFANCTPLKVNVNGGEKSLVCEQGGETQTLVFDDLLIAVGRKARLKGFGLETLGLEIQKTLPTNEFLQTQYPNIFACGDVVGPYQFTHVAAHQAWYAAINALFGRFRRFKVDYRVIPWTTFLDPEIARVGINEREAKEKNLKVEITRFDLEELDRAITESENYGFIKVLTEPGKDKILGVTIVGSHAAELLAEFVLAMKYGLGLNKILGTIHTYPTRSEANKYVAGAWKRAHAPEHILRWIKRYHQWQRN